MEAHQTDWVPCVIFSVTACILFIAAIFFKKTVNFTCIAYLLSDRWRQQKPCVIAPDQSVHVGTGGAETLQHDQSTEFTSNDYGLPGSERATLYQAKETYQEDYKEGLAMSYNQGDGTDYSQGGTANQVSYEKKHDVPTDERLTVTPSQEQAVRHDQERGQEAKTEISADKEVIPREKDAASSAEKDTSSHQNIATNNNCTKTVGEKPIDCMRHVDSIAESYVHETIYHAQKDGIHGDKKEKWSNIQHSTTCCDQRPSCSLHQQQPLTSDEQKLSTTHEHANVWNYQHNEAVSCNQKPIMNFTPKFDLVYSKMPTVSSIQNEVFHDDRKYSVCCDPKDMHSEQSTPMKSSRVHCATVTQNFAAGSDQLNSVPCEHKDASNVYQTPQTSCNWTDYRKSELHPQVTVDTKSLTSCGQPLPINYEEKEYVSSNNRDLSSCYQKLTTCYGQNISTNYNKKPTTTYIEENNWEDLTSSYKGLMLQEIRTGGQDDRQATGSTEKENRSYEDRDTLRHQQITAVGRDETPVVTSYLNTAASYTGLSGMHAIINTLANIGFNQNYMQLNYEIENASCNQVPVITHHLEESKSYSQQGISSYDCEDLLNSSSAHDKKDRPHNKEEIISEDTEEARYKGKETPNHHHTAMGLDQISTLNNPFASHDQSQATKYDQNIDLDCGNKDGSAYDHRPTSSMSNDEKPSATLDVKEDLSFEKKDAVAHDQKGSPCYTQKDVSWDEKAVLNVDQNDAARSDVELATHLHQKAAAWQDHTDLLSSKQQYSSSCNDSHLASLNKAWIVKEAQVGAGADSGDIGTGVKEDVIYGETDSLSFHQIPVVNSTEAVSVDCSYGASTDEELNHYLGNSKLPSLSDDDENKMHGILHDDQKHAACCQPKDIVRHEQISHMSFDQVPCVGHNQNLSICSDHQEKVISDTNELSEYGVCTNCQPVPSYSQKGVLSYKFKARDRVLLRVLKKTGKDGGKQKLTWKGPYAICKVFPNSTCMLSANNRTCNQRHPLANLKLFQEHISVTPRYELLESTTHEQEDIPSVTRQDGNSDQKHLLNYVHGEVVSTGQKIMNHEKPPAIYSDQDPSMNHDQKHTIGELQRDDIYDQSRIVSSNTEEAITPQKPAAVCADTGHLSSYDHKDGEGYDQKGAACHEQKDGVCDEMPADVSHDHSLAVCHSYKIGDTVLCKDVQRSLVNREKEKQPLKGPYDILETLQNNTFQLSEKRGILKQKHPLSHLKPYEESQPLQVISPDYSRTQTTQLEPGKEAESGCRIDFLTCEQKEDMNDNEINVAPSHENLAPHLLQSHANDEQEDKSCNYTQSLTSVQKVISDNDKADESDDQKDGPCLEDQTLSYDGKDIGCDSKEAPAHHKESAMTEDHTYIVSNEMECTPNFDFNVGDCVLLNDRNTVEQRGPYTIFKILGNHTCILSHNKRKFKQKYPLSQLRSFQKTQASEIKPVRSTVPCPEQLDSSRAHASYDLEGAVNNNKDVKTFDHKHVMGSDRKEYVSYEWEDVKRYDTKEPIEGNRKCMLVKEKDVMNLDQTISMHCHQKEALNYNQKDVIIDPNTSMSDDQKDSIFDQKTSAWDDQKGIIEQETPISDDQECIISEKKTSVWEDQQALVSSGMKTAVHEKKPSTSSDQELGMVYSYRVGDHILLNARKQSQGNDGNQEQQWKEPYTIFKILKNNMCVLSNKTTQLKQKQHLSNLRPAADRKPCVTVLSISDLTLPSQEQSRKEYEQCHQTDVTIDQNTSAWDEQKCIIDDQKMPAWDDQTCLIDGQNTSAWNDQKCITDHQKTSAWDDQKCIINDQKTSAWDDQTCVINELKSYTCDDQKYVIYDLKTSALEDHKCIIEQETPVSDDQECIISEQKTSVWEDQPALVSSGMKTAVHEKKPSTSSDQELGMVYSYRVGDHVLLNARKQSQGNDGNQEQQWKGPYTIFKILKNNMCVLSKKTRQLKQKQHLSNLRPATDRKPCVTVLSISDLTLPSQEQSRKEYEQCHQTDVTIDQNTPAWDEQKCIIDDQKTSVWDDQTCLIDDQNTSAWNDQKCITDHQKTSAWDDQACIIDDHKTSVWDHQKCVINDQETSVWDDQKCIINDQKTSAWDDHTCIISDQKTSAWDGQKCVINELKTSAWEDQKCIIDDQETSVWDDQECKIDERKTSVWEDQQALASSDMKSAVHEKKPSTSSDQELGMVYSYRVGDHVLLNARKQSQGNDGNQEQQWKGPYTIFKILKNNMCVLSNKTRQLKQKQHLLNLRPATDRKPCVTVLSISDLKLPSQEQSKKEYEQCHQTDVTIDQNEFQNHKRKAPLTYYEEEMMNNEQQPIGSFNLKDPICHTQNAILKYGQEALRGHDQSSSTQNAITGYIQKSIPSNKLLEDLSTQPEPSTSYCYRANDQVLVKGMKRRYKSRGEPGMLWKGPYTIVSILPNNTCELFSDKCKSILKQKFNLSNLKPFQESPSSETGELGTPSKWISDFDLDSTHKEILLSKDWLDDKIIDAAQNLLKMQYGMKEGLQTTLLSCTAEGFTPIQHEGVQIHFDDQRNHWLTSSYRGSCVELADSLPTSTISQSTQKQLKQCYGGIMRQGKLEVHLLSVDRQPNTDDCGLYAIANAVEFLSSEGNLMAKYDNKAMRPHLISCLENKKMTPFPKCPKIRRLSKNPQIKKIFVQ